MLRNVTYLNPTHSITFANLCPYKTQEDTFTVGRLGRVKINDSANEAITICRK